MRDECTHERTITVQGKVNDRVDFQWPAGRWTEDYFGDVPGLIDGDYIRVTVCLGCGTVLGLGDPDDILAMDPGPPPPPVPRQRVADWEPTCQVCGGEFTPADCPICGGEGGPFDDPSN